MDLKLEPESDQEFGRRDQINAALKEHVPPESVKRVESIMEMINSLNSLERLYLYLKLPGSCNRSGALGQDGLDPLRQPLNPLGSRAEIGLTITWIKTHLEEDPQVSLPKHEVYEEYLSYCSVNGVKPISTADFGKVMKQVYPQVRPRRLGTRGNSRYCYAGLRKRTKLEVPMTPDITSEGRGGEGTQVEEEQGSAASFLIREWVEKLLGVKFENLSELALHLLEKMYVDARSSAAYTLLSSVNKFPPSRDSVVSPSITADTKLPLHALTARIDPKRKLSSSTTDVEVGKKTKNSTNDIDLSVVGGNIMYAGSSGSTIASVHSAQASSVVVSGINNPSVLVSGGNGPVTSVGAGSGSGTTSMIIVGGGGGIVTATSQVPSVNHSVGVATENSAGVVSEYSNRISAINTTSQASRQPHSISLDKLPRKKQALAEVSMDGDIVLHNMKTEDSYKEMDWDPMKGEDNGAPGCWTGGEYDEPADLTTHQFYLSDKVGSGGSSSDAQEEELVRYFSQGDIDNSANSQVMENRKLSQLRELLEKNLKSPSGGPSPNLGGGGAFKRTNIAKLEPVGVVVSNPNLTSVAGGTASGATATPGQTLSNRRRVTFNQLTICSAGDGNHTETTVIGIAGGGPDDDGSLALTGGNGSTVVAARPVNNVSSIATSANSNAQQTVMGNVANMSGTNVGNSVVGGGGGVCPVPPSPGTRRRHYSFQPISPKSGLVGSLIGGGMNSSPPVSPFVSPRSTPVHMLRSRHSSGSALPLHLLPGGGRNHHASGNSDVSRAATYGSASESSTPFISPQGTPIPFSRSRHNSAQPRLCRSRHSSGLSLGGSLQYSNNNTARFNTMPYSPGALSNLNNPFSPQPATPLQGQEHEQNFLPANNQMQQGQFNTVLTGDPRSRHSSAESDQAPHSAPLSPYNPVPSVTRVRHQSAGAATSNTIHYRPELHTWTSNGDFTHSTLQFSNESVTGFDQASSQPPTPSPMDQTINQSFSYPVVTTHSSGYRNTPIHSEYHTEKGDLDILMRDDLDGSSNHHQQHNSLNNGLDPNGVGGADGLAGVVGAAGQFEENVFIVGTDDDPTASQLLNGTGGGKMRKDGANGGGGDELDLALSALRDCDTDFSKFLPEVGATSNNN